MQSISFEPSNFEFNNFMMSSNIVSMGNFCSKICFGLHRRSVMRNGFDPEQALNCLLVKWLISKPEGSLSPNQATLIRKKNFDPRL